MALSCIVSEIKQDIAQNGDYSYHLDSTPQLEGHRRNTTIKFGVEKTRLVWLPDGENV